MPDLSGGLNNSRNRPQDTLKLRYFNDYSCLRPVTVSC
jgi:hypothetical protein